MTAAPPRAVRPEEVFSRRARPVHPAEAAAPGTRHPAAARDGRARARPGIARRVARRPR
ncbi:hypothetical protein GA0115241_113241 [Streptomyces sp. DpondAA-D4]|nr:hypothetical protein GA0115249_1056145 [Streptomyces sp. PpalLS-921]SCE31440.1 hypothetical protein GA0115241_113241 [Streptomyces sp. DpondAA-D4]